MYNIINPRHAQKRILLGIISLLMGSTVTQGSQKPEKKVSVIKIRVSRSDYQYFFIQHKYMLDKNHAKTIPLALQNRAVGSYFGVWDQNNFSYQNEDSAGYTEKEMDDFLNEKNDNQAWKKDAKKAWRKGRIYFVDTNGNVASDTKANYFSGKAKVLSMDSNTLNIDTLNDGNNDNDDFKMPISNNDNSNISSHEKSDDNDDFNTSFVQENSHDDSTPASNEKNEYMTLFDKLSPHNKPQNNSNFHPAYLLLLIPLALIAWVVLSKEPTQDKSKDEKAAPSPTQADPVQAAA